MVKIINSGGTTMVIQKQKPAKSVAVWQPFEDLEEIGKSFDDLNGRPLWRGMWKRMPFEEMVWSPAIDVVEKEDEFIVKVELPGVKENDIDISITGDTLTVSGEKRSDSEVNKKGYYYSESTYGSFSRSVTIPSTINTDKIEANCEEGVLEITLPKIPEVKPKKISVIAKKKERKNPKKTDEVTVAKK
jgi:HSP20 family protein